MSKVNRNTSQAITEAETEVTSKFKSNENSLNLAKPSVSTDTLNGIEKRIRDLEASREVDCETQLKKIDKLEKIVGKISKGEKSPRKIKSFNVFHRTKSSGFMKKKEEPKKNVRFCVRVKDLENDLEKWKHRALVLEQKCFGEIKEIKKQLNAVKNEIKKESKDIKDTYWNIFYDALDRKQ